MKRILIIAVVTITFVASSAPAHAFFGFEPLGVDGVLRAVGFGFGQGYHSYPTNPALRQNYQRAQCQVYPVVPPPAYPCSPQAPETYRGGSYHGASFLEPMIDPLNAHDMQSVNQSEIDIWSRGGAIDEGNDRSHSFDSDLNSDRDAADLRSEELDPLDRLPEDTDESVNDWSEIPDVTPRTPINPEEDSHLHEPIPNPEPDSTQAEIGLPGAQMLDELESYFDDDVTPSSPSHQSQIRRLPPTTEEVLTTQPGGEGVPAATPEPSESDIWW